MGSNCRVACRNFVKAAPIVGKSIGLGLVPHQFLKEMFRVVADGIAIMTSFLNKQLPACPTGMVPKLESDSMDCLVVAIIGVAKGPGTLG